MGGKALQTHFKLEIDRVDSFQVDRLTTFCKNRLAEYLQPQPLFCLVPTYKTKTDHGDLDFLVGTDQFLTQADFAKMFHTEFVFQNGNCFSVLVENYQMDFIVVSPSAFSAEKFFRGYSPFGMIFSKMLRQLDVVLKTDGLFYRLKIEGHRENTLHVEDILLTRDPSKILEFASVRNWFVETHQTVSWYNEEDLFYFMQGCKLFRKDTFSLENEDHKTRQRIHKRPDYVRFLEYIKDKPDKLYSVPTKESNLVRIQQAFPHLIVEMDKIYKGFVVQEYTDRETCSKFNGNLVSAWTGLEGVHLGDFMYEFKRQHEDFIQYLLDHSGSQVKEDVKKYCDVLKIQRP